MNIQFKKGVLELLVLSLLHKRDFYGYELVEHISRDISISEGTIYPLLRKFRNEGYVDTYLQESQAGPPRKYYKLTTKGKEVYEVMEVEWQAFIKGVNNIIRSEIID